MLTDVDQIDRGKPLQLLVRLAGKKIPVDIRPMDKELYITSPFFQPFIDEIKSFAGAKWHPVCKEWSVTNNKRNWFSFGILTRSEGSERYYQEVIKHIDYMWKHQNDIYNFERTRQRCLIGSEPRTGKTRPTLQCFLDSDFKHGWLISKKNALLGIPREIRKWWPETPLSYDEDNLPIGNKKLTLMSYDKFTSIMQTLPVGSRLPGFIIFDECHSLKTPHSQRTEQAIRCVDMIEEYYRTECFVLGLSGTPAPKDPSDWWAQCEVIRSGFIKEGDINKFKKRYGNYKPWDGSTPAWERFEGWNKEEVSKLYTRLGGLVQIHMQKDCMDLPETRYEVVELTPSKELLRVAKLITETSNGALETRRRLRQLSDGFEYTYEYNENTNKERRASVFVGSPKIDQLKEDLDEYSEIGRIVIYSGFQGSVDIVRQVCLENGWLVLQIDGRGRALHTSSFVDGSSEALQLALGEMDRSTDTGSIKKLAVVAETEAGGAGLELSASPVIIYYSNSDSGEGRMQSEFRAKSANMDKTRGLTVKDYILLPTDLLIRNKLLEKKELQAISMGEMRECFNN